MRAYLVVLLLLAGCATRPEPQYRWVHDAGASQVQFDRDYGQCAAQALGSHPASSVERGVAMFGACMRGLGWRLVEL